MTRNSGRAGHLVAAPSEGVIGIFVDAEVREAVEYLIEDGAEAIEPTQSVREGLSLIGAWSHLDWDAALEALDRIRHESKPTPPIIKQRIPGPEVPSAGRESIRGG